MSADIIDRSMDIVRTTDLNKRQEEFVTVILSLIALRLSSLGPAGREQTLKAIEANGGLLHVAEKFRGSQRSPEVPLGYLH